MKKMVDEGKLGVRLWVMVRQPNEVIAPKLAQYRMIDYGDGHLTVRAIKKQIDGALGSRGAWLLEPYADKPDSSGLNTTSVADIDETAELAIQNDFQLCVHAIGDRANRETLDIFERAFKANPDKKDLRWRDRARAAPQRRGHPALRRSSASSPRCRGSTARRTRRTCSRGWARSGARGRRLRLAEADEDRRGRRQRHRRAGRGRRSHPELLRDRHAGRLKTARCSIPTSAWIADGGAAVLHMQRRLRGVRGRPTGASLKRGKYADITVLSKDITRIPEAEILSTKVVYTIVGGKVVYKK